MVRPRQLPVSQVLDPVRFVDYEAGSSRSPTVAHVVRLIDHPGMRVCDVGGATGLYLQAISGRAEHPFQGAVMEIDPFYRDKQVDPRVEFIHASILNSGLPDGRFDLITFRHVLHHLVSRTVSDTLALQRRGLSEMLRLLAPGGHLIFQEQINRVGLFSRLVYHLSSFTSRRRLRWRYFETGVVVVSFMTPSEVAQAISSLANETPIEVVHSSFERRQDPLRWRVTLLMAFGGDVTYVIRKLQAVSTSTDV